MDENLQDNPGTSEPELEPATTAGDPLSEHIELSPEDQADLEALYGEEDGEEADPVPFVPILKVWREVLAPARTEANKPISPQWAIRVVQSYPEIRFADMPMFQKLYYGFIDDLLVILETEIESDPDCLTYSTPEDDVENNGAHYAAVLRDWQIDFMHRELAWSPADADAATWIAVMGEVHKAIFGQTGITQFLDNIRFEYTEAQAQEVADILAAMKAEVTGE